MGDFVNKSTVSNAERVLATPFASKAAMNTIIGTILAENPWGCTPYMSAGETIPAVVKGTENYTGAVIYENNDGKQVGRISVRSPSSGSFDTTVSNLLANAAIETAMGGTASHDSSDDRFVVALKCHSSTGERYTVTFRRDRITISSFESSTIKDTIETWADTVSELA